MVKSLLVIPNRSQKSGTGKTSRYMGLAMMQYLAYAYLIEALMTSAISNFFHIVNVGAPLMQGASRLVGMKWRVLCVTWQERAHDASSM